MNDGHGWEVRFAIDNFKIHTSAADAVAAPVCLGSKISLGVTATPQKSSTLSLSLSAKDAAGNRLSSVNGQYGRPVNPTVTLLDKEGKELVKDKKFEFG